MRVKKFRKFDDTKYAAPHFATSTKRAVRVMGPHQAPAGQRNGIYHIIDLVRTTTGVANPRVLELGAGSGRLADLLIRKEGIKPENYCITDIKYNTGGRTGGKWTLKRSIFNEVKAQRMQAVKVNVHTAPPAELKGKFQLIMMPEVSGGPETLLSLVTNYFDKLAPGGYLIADRALCSHHMIKAISSKKKYEKEHAYFKEVPIARRLMRVLEFLRREGKISYNNYDEIFWKNANSGRDLFVLQKVKN